MKITERVHPYGWTNGEKLRSYTISEIDRRLVDMKDKLCLQNFSFRNFVLGSINLRVIDYGYIFGNTTTPAFILAGDDNGTISLGYSFDGYTFSAMSVDNGNFYLSAITNTGVLYLAQDPAISATNKLAVVAGPGSFSPVANPSHGDTALATALHYSTRLAQLIVSYANGRMEYIPIAALSESTNATKPGAWTGAGLRIAESPTTLVVVPDDTTTSQLMSTNGTSWSLGQMPEQSNWNVVYSDSFKKFVATNSDGSIYTAPISGSPWTKVDRDPVVFTNLEVMDHLLVGTRFLTIQSTNCYSDDLGLTWHEYPIGLGPLVSFKTRLGSCVALIDNGSGIYFVKTPNIFGAA